MTLTYLLYWLACDGYVLTCTFACSAARWWRLATSQSVRTELSTTVVQRRGTWTASLAGRVKNLWSASSTSRPPPTTDSTADAITPRPSDLAALPATRFSIMPSSYHHHHRQHQACSRPSWLPSALELTLNIAYRHCIIVIFSLQPVYLFSGTYVLLPCFLVWLSVPVQVID